MRAFVVNDKISKFMQAADVFDKHKVVYLDLDLKYFVKNTKTGEESELETEKFYVELAKNEFGDNLILLFGKEKPLFINPNVQVVSNGEKWGRLIDVLKYYYKNIEFSHDERFMNITFKDEK